MTEHAGPSHPRDAAPSGVFPSRIRAIAAGNPGLPPGLLPRLPADEAQVATAAGTSVHLPVAWMEALLEAEGLG